MHPLALETIISNHQHALDTCKSLIKDGRQHIAIRILMLAEKNINRLYLGQTK